MHQPLHYTATNSVAEILENPNITFESIMKCDVASERPLRQQCALWQPHGVYRRRKHMSKELTAPASSTRRSRSWRPLSRSTRRGSANTERVPRALSAAGRQRLDGMRLT
jgi:hypothetical protein